MSEVTRILCAIEEGEPHAVKQLLPLVYDELRKLAAQRLAHEKPGQTLDATGLVHESYLLGSFKGHKWRMPHCSRVNNSRIWRLSRRPLS